jgi:hypothetical protein
MTPVRVVPLLLDPLAASNGRCTVVLKEAEDTHRR